MAHLIARSADHQGAVFPLLDDVTSIGRHPENEIVISDSAVSRFHAKVLCQESHFQLYDLGSTHGTFVNGARCADEQPLAENDLVRLGNSEFIFKSGKTPVARRTDPLFGSDAPTKLPPAEEPDTAPEAEPGPKETIAFSLPAHQPSSPSSSSMLTDKHSEMLARVADAIQSVFDVDHLLERLMDTLFDIFKPERGVILLYDEAERTLVPKVTRPDGQAAQLSQTIVHHAIDKRMSLLISDIASDQRFSEAQSVMLQSIRSAICAPLVHKDRVLGVVYVDTQTGIISYQKQDLALLNIIAANAAISIENAVLVREKVEAERLAAIGVAVAGISHYVKNILAGVKGSSKLIEMGLDGDNMKLVKEAWPILQRSNAKLSSVVQDMLTYSKAREPNWEEGNLNHTVSDVFENQLRRAADLGVELLLECDDELPDSAFEASGIHDCYLNLVGNAIEACDDTPDAQVILRTTTDPRNGTVSAWVVDNGPGMPEEIQRRIFEPFFSTKGSKGTGLGLAVTKKTVEEHQGRLELDSTPGKGTTFKITLPVMPEISAALSKTPLV